MFTISKKKAIILKHLMEWRIGNVYYRYISGASPGQTPIF